VALLAEAALYASNGTARFQERYLMALLPLVPLLYAVRARPRKVAIAFTIAAALALVVVATWVPLSTFTAGQDAQGSPTLNAGTAFERWLGIATGPLLFAAVASILALTAAAMALGGRHDLTVGFGCALGACLVLAVSSTWLDQQSTGRTRAFFLAADPSWV